jgi:HK97 family phage portal protein
MRTRWTHPPERNTAEWIGNFRTSPRLAVVDRIATDMAMIPGKLYRINPDGKEVELKEHPFLDFWARPNPLLEYSGTALWRLQQIYLLLKGEGYFIIEREEIDPELERLGYRGRPAELWPVPVHWVYGTPYLDHPFYDVRTPGGQMLPVSVDDMFVMKRLNPFDPSARGLGQAEALADEVEIDEYAAKFQKKFFFNDATPETIVSMPGATDEQQNRFLAQWKQRLQGAFRSHSVMTVGGPKDAPISVMKLGENMKDMDMLQGRTQMRDACLEHFGVPREIMGITESSNRATSEAAQYIYARMLTNELSPRMDAVNEQLVCEFGDDLIYRYDDIIPRNEEFDKGLALDFWNAGIITKNQALEKGGFPTIGCAGEVYKTNFADMFIRKDEDPAQVTAAAANLQYVEGAPPMDDSPAGEIEIDLPGGKGRFFVIHTKARQAKAVTIQQLLRSEQEAAQESLRDFEVATSRYLKAQTDEMRKALGGAVKADGDSGMHVLDDYIQLDGSFDLEAWNALTESKRQSLALEAAAGLLDWPAQGKALEQLFTPLWSQAFGAGAGQAKQLYGLADLNQPQLSAHARKLGAQRVVRINDTTKEKIAATVTQRIADGGSTRELARDIIDTMQTNEKRAGLIARQETMTSLSDGQFEMMKSAGAKTKTWHHNSTTKYKRPSHIAMNGKTVDINAWFEFPSGAQLRFPRDPQGKGKKVAGEVIECRCAVTYNFR